MTLLRKYHRGLTALMVSVFLTAGANLAMAQCGTVTEEGTISLSVVKELGEDQKPSDLLNALKEKLQKIAKDNNIELINRSSIDMSISNRSYARREIVEVYLNAYLYFKDNPKAADVYYEAMEPNSFSYSSSRYEDTSGCKAES